MIIFENFISIKILCLENIFKNFISQRMFFSEFCFDLNFHFLKNIFIKILQLMNIFENFHFCPLKNFTGLFLIHAGEF